MTDYSRQQKAYPSTLEIWAKCTPVQVGCQGSGQRRASTLTNVPKITDNESYSRRWDKQMVVVHNLLTEHYLEGILRVGGSPSHEMKTLLAAHNAV